MSLVEQMTAEAQSARDAFPHNTVLLNGKTYPIREPWEAVVDRAAAKFGAPGNADEEARYAAALKLTHGGKPK